MASLVRIGVLAIQLESPSLVLWPGQQAEEMLPDLAEVCREGGHRRGGGPGGGSGSQQVRRSVGGAPAQTGGVKGHRLLGAGMAAVGRVVWWVRGRGPVEGPPRPVRVCWMEGGGQGPFFCSLRLGGPTSREVPPDP